MIDQLSLIEDKRIIKVRNQDNKHLLDRTYLILKSSHNTILSYIINLKGLSILICNFREKIGGKFLFMKRGLILLLIIPRFILIQERVLRFTLINKYLEMITYIKFLCLILCLIEKSI